VKLEEKNSIRRLEAGEELENPSELETHPLRHGRRKSSTISAARGDTGSRNNNMEQIEVLETYYMEPNSDSAIGQGLSIQTTTDYELSESYL
jgi:hypothetical protein